MLLIASYLKGPSESNAAFTPVGDTTKYVEEFQKRAKDDERYNKVIQNIESYPEDVIKLLYSNGETLDFVLSKDNFKSQLFNKYR